MKFLITLFPFLVSVNVHAQIRAVTEVGEEVLLYKSGEWRYANEPLSDTIPIETNTTVFTSSENQTFDILSKNTNTIVKLDAKKWSFGPSKNNPEAEYEFRLKQGDLYGILITEGLEIPLENLANIAFQNAKGVASDMRIVKKEYRQVNGQKVIYLEMTGSSNGIEFIYMSYYYSNLTGSTQLVTWTGQNLRDKYYNETISFLNGLTINM